MLVCCFVGVVRLFVVLVFVVVVLVVPLCLAPAVLMMGALTRHGKAQSETNGQTTWHF